MLTKFLKKRKEKLTDIEERGDLFRMNLGQERDPSCAYCIQYRLLLSRTVANVYPRAIIDNIWKVYVSTKEISNNLHIKLLCSWSRGADSLKGLARGAFSFLQGYLFEFMPINQCLVSCSLYQSLSKISSRLFVTVSPSQVDSFIRSAEISLAKIYVRYIEQKLFVLIVELLFCFCFVHINFIRTWMTQ